MANGPLISILNPFISDVARFRRALEESGTILVGSILVPLLMPTEKPLSVTELSLFGSWDAITIVGKILGQEGYQPATHPSGTFVFDRNRDRRSIWLTLLDGSPQSYFVQKCTTTKEMFFFTGKYVVCMCPRLTQSRKYAIIGLQENLNVGKLMQVLGERDFKLVETGDELDIEPRSIGDTYSWIAAISEEGHAKEVAPEEREPVVKDFYTSEFSLRIRNSDM